MCLVQNDMYGLRLHFQASHSNSLDTKLPKLLNNKCRLHFAAVSCAHRACGQDDIIISLTDDDGDPLIHVKWKGINQV